MFQRRQRIMREIRVVMAWRLVREKRPQVPIVELQKLQATQRLVLREMLPRARLARQA